MLNEYQVRMMLQECERRIGRELSALRKRLLHHRSPIEAVWELVNIHAAAMVGRVTEESHSEPDLCLALPGHESVVWIEATHVSPRCQSELDDSHAFPSWLRRELNRAGVETKNLHVELSPRQPGLSANLKMPPRNAWRRVKATKAWHQFARNVLDSGGAQLDLGPEYDLIASVRPGAGCVSVAPALGIPRSPQEHVVYRAIRSKAKQVAKRQRRHEHQPLMLSICGSHPDARLDSMGAGAIKADQAVAAALADTSTWSSAEMHNYIGSDPRKRLRVPGAEFISAVLITQLEDPAGEWPPRGLSRRAQTRMVGNPAARRPLTQAMLEQLKALHFNHYRYGPQWGEAWQEPLDNGGQQVKRRLRQDDSITIGLGRFGVNTVEMSTSAFLRVLSGQASAEEVVMEGSAEAWGMLRSAFSEGREVQALEVIPGDPRTGRAQRVKIVLGEPIPPVVAVRKVKPEG